MSKASDAWTSELRVSLPRHCLERAIRSLDKIEALALIRAAYTCTVAEAQEILALIKK